MKTKLLLLLCIVLSGCTAKPEPMLVTSAPIFLEPRTIDVVIPASIQTPIVPREVNVKIITHDVVVDELEPAYRTSGKPYVYWCYDETNTLAFNAWLDDVTAYINRGDIENRTLRTLLQRIKQQLSKDE